MRSIHADTAKTNGVFDHFFQKCVGSGHARLALHENYRQQIKTAVEELGFRYIRFHGLFHEDMAVCRRDKEGKLSFHFTYVDSVFDYLLSIGIRPFVELGFMPKTMASGDSTVFYWSANITPPNEYEEWYRLVFETVRHLVERYGMEEVKTWYFEVWNEPNHSGFFTGTIDDYFKLYDYAAKAVKDVAPELRVGGPATAGNAWVGELIAHCRNTGTELDFITTHTYGAGIDFDEYGEKCHFIDPKDCHVVGGVDKVYSIVRESSMPWLEIHYTEWSASSSSRDPVHDSYFSASYILSRLKQVQGHVDSMSYWTFSDVFEEGGPGDGEFHGGFGLLTQNGVKKPSYFAYQYLNMMKDIELANNDPDSIVCMSDDEITVLAWDYTHNFDGQSNQSVFSKLYESSNAGKLHICLENIPSGRYEVEVRHTGYLHNDPYSVHLSDGELQSQNEPEITVVEIDGIYEIELDLKTNDVYLIRLIRA